MLWTLWTGGRERNAAVRVCPITLASNLGFTTVEQHVIEPVDSRAVVPLGGVALKSHKAIHNLLNEIGRAAREACPGVTVAHASGTVPLRPSAYWTDTARGVDEL